MHCFISEEIEKAEVCKVLVKRIMENSKVPYITITPTFSVCPDHGYLSGEHASCIKCGKETELWTRVVGFHRPVQAWNKGKKEEFKQRLEFSVSKSLDMAEVLC